MQKYQQQIEQPATYWQLFLYGQPGLPLAMLGLPLYVFLPTFYAEFVGLPLATVGLALLLARITDVLTDPLIGTLNDKIRPGKLGRRKTFILLGLPLLLCGLEFLLRPAEAMLTDGISPLSGGIYLFFWSFVTYLGWTLIFIPWQAWGAEISTDFHSKSSLSASREVFAVVGTLLVIGIPVLLGLGENQRLTLNWLATAFWWLFPVCLLLPIIWLKDHSVPSRRTPDVIEQNYRNSEEIQTGPEKDTVWASFFKAYHRYIGLMRQHDGLVKLVPAWFLNSLANAFPATLFILFVTHVLQASEQTGNLLLIYFISAIAGLPFWLWLSRLQGKTSTWNIALIVSAVSFAVVPLLGPGQVGWFMVVCIVTGLSLGADVVLPASIQADIAQRLKHAGKDVTGLLFGFWGLLTKLALALAVGIAFPLLGIAGFEQQQSRPESLMLLALLYGFVPVLLKLMVILLLRKMTDHQFAGSVSFQSVHITGRRLSDDHDQVDENDSPLISGRR